MARPTKKPNAQGEYQCSICKEWLHPILFFPAKQTKAGLSSACKECIRLEHNAKVTEELLGGPLPEKGKKRERAVLRRLEVKYNFYPEVLLELLERDGQESIGDYYSYIYERFEAEEEEVQMDYKFQKKIQTLQNQGLPEYPDPLEEVMRPYLAERKKEFYVLNGRWPNEKESKNLE